MLTAGGVGFASIAAMPNLAFASGASRQISLFSTHRHEVLTAEYWRDGWYNPDVLSRIDYFLRDWRSQEFTQMDPALIDIIYYLHRVSGSEDPIHIVSAYRSPTTNAMLADRNRGVARNSYHMYGQACDVRLPGYDLAALRDAALDLEAGGVGYYARSEFVHVDTGPVRDW